MIGNDVIDIAAARNECQWNRRGRIEKLCSISEQAIIATAPNPETMFWTIWSMKESAYKIIYRKTGERGFYPKKLDCSIKTLTGGSITGTVKFETLLIFTSTKISLEKIDTIATAGKSDVKVVDPSLIIKKNGLPYITEGGTDLPVSLSHHGRFSKAVRIS